MNNPCLRKVVCVFQNETYSIEIATSFDSRSGGKDSSMGSRLLLRLAQNVRLIGLSGSFDGCFQEEGDAISTNKLGSLVDTNASRQSDLSPNLFQHLDDIGAAEGQARLKRRWHLNYLLVPANDNSPMFLDKAA